MDMLDWVAITLAVWIGLSVLIAAALWFRN